MVSIALIMSTPNYIVKLRQQLFHARAKTSNDHVGLIPYLQYISFLFMIALDILIVSRAITYSKKKVRLCEHVVYYRHVLKLLKCVPENDTTLQDILR